MQCVAWFRAQYPQYSMLLTHPINEGSRNTARTGGIHKAEGTVAGVPDLLLFLPAFIDGRHWHGLGIEFKTKTGKQSQQQKDFQQMFEAAGYRYVVIRDFGTFKVFMELWVAAVAVLVSNAVKDAHHDIVKAAEEREKEKFYKIIGKKKPVIGKKKPVIAKK